MTAGLESYFVNLPRYRKRFEAATAAARSSPRSKAAKDLPAAAQEYANNLEASLLAAIDELNRIKTRRQLYGGD